MMQLKLIRLAALTSLTLFAEGHSAPLTGDLDGNGKLTSLDSHLCRSHVAGVSKLSDERQKMADANADGKVDAVDCFLIRHAIAGNISLPKKIKFGDVDGNGKITSNDSTIVRRHIANISVLSGEKLIAADVNADARVDDKDVELIRRAAAGMVTLPASP